jgi:hypothetical protein
VAPHILAPDSAVRLVQVGADLLHTRLRGAEIAQEPGHDFEQFVAKLLLINFCAAAVIDDHVTVDDDSLYATAGFGVHELAHSVIERQPGRVGEVKEGENGAIAGFDLSDVPRPSDRLGSSDGCGSEYFGCLVGQRRIVANCVQGGGQLHRLEHVLAVAARRVVTPEGVANA